MRYGRRRRSSFRRSFRGRRSVRRGGRRRVRAMRIGYRM